MDENKKVDSFDVDDWLGLKYGVWHHPYITLRDPIKGKEETVELSQLIADFTNDYLKMKTTKTKRCNWCNKRKKIESIYKLGKLKPTDNKEWNICEKCNLKHDVV